jgi:TetR/AcrR family transcriptional repressor of lmrAB and yxaGH operons
MVITTAKLMRRQGYHGTGLNQIVAEAAAPKGSMYFHFPGGKEQLAAEAIAASAAYLDAAMVASEGSTTLESLDRYLVAAGRTLERSDYTEGCPLATVVLEVAPTSTVIGDACADAIELLLTRLAEWFERDGFTADRARQRAQVIYAAIEGALVLAKALRSTEPLAALREQLPELVRLDRHRAAKPTRRRAVAAS